MKKKILGLTVGLLLLGGNLFAAGDLIVNGKLGVGTSSASAKMDIVTTNEKGFEITVFKDTSVGAGLQAMTGDTFFDFPSGEINGAQLGAFSNRHISGNLTAAGQFKTFFYENVLAASSGTWYLPKVIALEGTGAKIQGFAGTYNIDEVIGLSFQITRGGDSGGTQNITDAYGIKLQGDVGFASTNITNQYGLHLSRMTSATNNYGIYLEGDGAGSDIVFGPVGQKSRIYSSGGVLWADDSLGSHTQISPHDPATGEWIYYSKNINTGKVVRVNMEKLVKAVERLTGEKFMIETFEEIK